MTRREAQLVMQANEALAQNGFRLLCGGYRDKHPLLDTPEGKRARVMIQVSARANQGNGRHLFGISHRYFDHKELFVFFTGDEATFLVVPTPVLQNVLEVNRDDVKIVRTQWHVNIFYDWGGTHVLHPVCRCESFTLPKYPLSEFALPVDAPVGASV